MKTFNVYYGGNAKVNMDMVAIEAMSIEQCAEQVKNGLFIDRKWVSPWWIRYIEEIEPASL